ncbi:hypothetical protein [Olivibacter sp. 47]|uniref:hypothetical protein n=1 Tax=Olivibacter sp. 47 TaxID=3056486 RepID=UPI0025A4958D|nr:hypothetical protein [Olivibacter sp. 47]
MKLLTIVLSETLHLLVLILLMGASGISYAQNTFPATGNVGIGTSSPTNKLDIRGTITMENGTNASIFTGIGSSELNRYLTLLNSATLASASGLKAGGILVADAYAYANPGKNDLIVKGSVGIGTPSPQAKLDLQGGGLSISGSNPTAGINGFKNVFQIKATDHAAIIFNPREATELMFGFHTNGSFYWGTGANYVMQLNKTGDAHISNTLSVGGALKSGSKLSVKGKISAQEVEVTTSNWPDYVFDENYEMKSLAEIEAFVNEHKHLPGIPSKKEAEEAGVNLGDMNRKLLEKVEELTLHLIEKDKELTDVKDRLLLLEQAFSKQ